MELFEVKIPHSGSVENVEITDWIVSVGDVVAEGDSLAEVSTDKVDTELEAPQGGQDRQVPLRRGHRGDGRHGGRPDGARRRLRRRRELPPSQSYQPSPS